GEVQRVLPVQRPGGGGEVDDDVDLELATVARLLKLKQAAKPHVIGALAIPRGPAMALDDDRGALTPIPGSANDRAGPAAEHRPYRLAVNREGDVGEVARG